MQAVKRNAPGRQQAMLQMLSDHGEINVADLSSRFDVSEMTVRRDLAQMESAGLVRRTRGGAALTGVGSLEPPFAMRMHTNPGEKAEAAAIAAAQVQDGQTVIVDGGSTGVAIAKALVGRRITVCALNLRVADVLSADSATRVMVPAGSIRTGEGSISGPEVETTLRQYRFDLFLLTASGVDLREGFTEWNREDAAVKRIALENARGSIAVFDSSKWGSVAFARLCPLDGVDALVCDSTLELDARRELGAAGINLLLSR